MNALAEQMCELYVSRNVGTGGVCATCKEESRKAGNEHIGPVPIYHIGEHYHEDPYRLVFVGSVAYGWDEILGDRRLSDPEQCPKIMEDVEERFREIFFHEGTQYRYIGALRAIVSKVFGSLESGYSRVAITNIIHCNAGNIRGGVKSHMGYYCAHGDTGLMLTKRELDVLKPEHMVSLAGRSGGQNYITDHWGLDGGTWLGLPHPAASQKGNSYEEISEKVVRFLKEQKKDG